MQHTAVFCTNKNIRSCQVGREGFDAAEVLAQKMPGIVG